MLLPAILRNSILLPNGQTLSSNYRYDYKSIVIERNFYVVDGGHDYIRHSYGNDKLAINTSISINDWCTLDEMCDYFHWGKNYTKSGKLLKQTKWIPLNKLSTSHIKNILERPKLSNYKLRIDPFYKILLEYILYKRQNLIKNDKGRNKIKGR